MSIIDECVQFLEDLILGDFNGEQMVSAQVIGGLISLIPVMDQVMDARDMSGCLYRVNKRGGFPKATLDDKVDLGFAAFGVVPAVGSAFKTVFKPLYKQRKTANGIVNSGVAMVERMLGHRKGGAVRWVKTMDWAENTQAAILQVDLALESCISLLEYLSQAHWWCSDRVELLARDVAPSLRSMRGKLAKPIREAADEIKEFLEDLLGEHAAAVAMMVATGATVGTRVGVTGIKSRPSAKSVHKDVADRPRIQGKTAKAGIINSVQNTAYQLYGPLDKLMKGLIGEHIIEHHVIEQKKWGLKWNAHDVQGGVSGVPGGWQSEPRKLNDNEIPLYLCTPKNVIVQSGIDSAWLTDRSNPVEFAVVEAKASMNANPKLLNLLSEAKDSQASKNGSTSGRRRTNKRTDSTAELPSEKMGFAPVMQMSRSWIDFRIRRDLRLWQGRMLLNYSRHVMVICPLQAVEHIHALAKIVENNLVANPVGAQKFAHIHVKHDIQKEFGDVDLINAEREYKLNGLPKVPPKRKGK